MLLLRDVVTAIGIGLEGHGRESQRTTDGEAPAHVGFAAADGRPADPCNRSFTAQRARSSSRRRMFEFRFPPITEPGDRPAPGTSTQNVEYPSFRAGGRGLFKCGEGP
jgi:hypothetical protein